MHSAVEEPLCGDCVNVRSERTGFSRDGGFYIVFFVLSEDDMNAGSRTYGPLLLQDLSRRGLEALYIEEQ